MIKLYDLVFEARIKNDIDLGDKTQEFEKKLALMDEADNNRLIETVRTFNDTEKEQFKSLINRYSSVTDLTAPTTPMEVKIAKLYVKGGNIGPGEVLFHLELEDSSMVADTNHDLVVKGKVWEVKKIDTITTIKKGDRGGSFRTAKKGIVSQFNFAQNLYKMVFFLERVTKLLPKFEEDFDDISPDLLNSLRKWSRNITKKYTPMQAILQGEQSFKLRKFMVKLINDIKAEIEVNTDDEFTTVKFGGVNITPAEKSIDPVSISNMGDDSVTLNFISDSTLKILEILNELPYAREGDFETDLDDAVQQVIKGLPNLILFSFEGKLLVVPEEKLEDSLEFDTISQNGINLRPKPEVWEKL